MSAQMIAQTIQFILAPAVMVNACAVALGGLLAHYAVINERLRRMSQERLEIFRVHPSTPPDAFTTLRLEEIQHQLPDLLERHKLVRNAILAIFLAVLLYVLTMLIIALAATGTLWVATFALVLFLLSTGVLLVGVLYTVVEIHRSHRAVAYEVQSVSQLQPERLAYPVGGN